MRSAKQKKAVVLADLLGGLRGVAGAFERMEIAEEEIKRAGKPEPPGIFSALCPSSVLEGFDQQLYRLHARELIQRARRGEDRMPATDAELLACMSRTSLDAPLNREGMAVYTYLYDKLFPERGIKDQPAGVACTSRREAHRDAQAAEPKEIESKP